MYMIAVHEYSRVVLFIIIANNAKLLDTQVILMRLWQA